MKRQKVEDMPVVTVEPNISLCDDNLTVTVVVKGDPVERMGCQKKARYKEDGSVYQTLAQLEKEVLDSLFEHRCLPYSPCYSLSPQSEALAIFRLVEVIEENIKGYYTIVYEFDTTVS